MTTISPLLQNRLNATNTNAAQIPNNKHEKIYQDLQKRAHEAKPNEAKAVMVKEGILGNPITAIKDTFQDGANFVKSVKTGEMGDNNLGRINDFGLKIGAGLIAAFLATHAKTKTDAIMQFIGGGTFLAAMSLWPKLFINLPARLVHGFRIDRKYISAQGDKKDFFLDNQFLVWDAYPEEQLRKDAKNAGIDYDAKNGKEKIQRKMQKTALQNRTLWMATAGFATPLMTSMIGNFVEPKVEKAVVDHGVKKSKGIVEGGIKQYLESVKATPTNSKEIEGLISSYKGKALDDDFFKQLGKSLSFNSFATVFKDSDDAKVITDLSSSNLVEELRKIYEQTATINKKDFMANITEVDPVEKALKEALGELGEEITIQTSKLEDGSIVDQLEVTKEARKAIEAAFGDKETLSIAELKKVLKANNYSDGIISSTIEKTAKNSDEFFGFVKKYNDEILSQIKNRAKAYLDILNPVVGSKAESQYTLEFKKSMTQLFNGLGIKAKDLKEFREYSDDGVITKLSGMIQSALESVGNDEQKYKELLQRISLAPSEDKSVAQIIEALANPENIRNITPETTKIGEVDISALNKAILGGQDDSKGLFGLIKSFINKKNVDIEAVKSKAIICANFERRVKAGEFKDVLSDSELEVARKMIYDGTISSVKNRVEVEANSVYHKIVDTLFDTKAYNSAEKEAMPEIESVVDNLKTIFKQGKVAGRTPTEDYLSCGSASKLVRDFATRLGNNKAWMKIFGTMSIALVAITLLVQPLFGKIDKEFPDEGKNGGAK